MQCNHSVLSTFTDRIDKSFSHTGMHDATSPGLSQFVLQPKHVGHAKQEAFQKGEKKILHAVFTSTLKPTTEPLLVTPVRTRGTGRM